MRGGQKKILIAMETDLNCGSSNTGQNKEEMRYRKKKISIIVELLVTTRPRYSSKGKRRKKNCFVIRGG
jgi:hypothetical protein